MVGASRNRCSACPPASAPILPPPPPVHPSVHTLVPKGTWSALAGTGAVAPAVSLPPASSPLLSSFLFMLNIPLLFRPPILSFPLLPPFPVAASGGVEDISYTSLTYGEAEFVPLLRVSLRTSTLLPMPWPPARRLPRCLRCPPALLAPSPHALASVAP